MAADAMAADTTAWSAEDYGYRLATLSSGHRTVAYAAMGPEDGQPVLVFYPAGGNRRMLPTIFRGLLSDDARALRLVCVNRPGKGETSPADDAGAPAHVDAACSDTVAVLAALGVHQASLAFMCAGTPFALAFASRYPERVAGSVGVSPWVLPQDCGETSWLLRAGAKLPTWLLCPVAGSSMQAGSSLGSLPTWLAAKGFKGNLSARECELLAQRYPEEGDLIAGILDIGTESGGEAVDVEVCLGGAELLGIDYSALHGAHLVWGQLDNMVSRRSAEWLASKLPACTTKFLPETTHNGAIMLFDPDVSRVFSTLRARRVPATEAGPPGASTPRTSPPTSRRRRLRPTAVKIAPPVGTADGAELRSDKATNGAATQNFPSEHTGKDVTGACTGGMEANASAPVEDDEERAAPNQKTRRGFIASLFGCGTKSAVKN